MNGENRPLVTYEAVEFEDWIRKIATYNRLDLEILGSWRLWPKFYSDSVSKVRGSYMGFFLSTYIWYPMDIHATSDL